MQSLIAMLHKPGFNQQNWLARMHSVVTKIMTGWRIPLCARKGLAEQLSESLMSVEDSESFERILSESLRKVQYD